MHTRTTVTHAHATAASGLAELPPFLRDDRDVPVEQLPTVWTVIPPDDDRCTTHASSRATNCRAYLNSHWPYNRRTGEHLRRHTQLPRYVAVTRIKAKDPLACTRCLFDPRRDVTDPLLLPPSSKLLRWRTPVTWPATFYDVSLYVKGLVDGQWRLLHIITWPSARVRPMREVLP